ncbi:MAG: Sec-independent protein translocase protein TatB [Hyphomicrobium sp.]
MFEIGWSELLILAIVTLIFVGPKELPVFLRTLGRYAGSIKRQAAEFRSQFDAAMREAELDTMRKEMEALQASVNAEVMGAKAAVNEAVSPPVMDKLPLRPIVESAAAATSAAAVTAPTTAAPTTTAPALPMPPMPAPPRMEP